MLGKMEQAMECFERVLSLQPSNFSALRNLVLVFINLEKYEDALTHLEKILFENPNDFEFKIIRIFKENFF